MDRIRVLKAGIVNYEVMSKSMKDLQKLRIRDLIPDTIIFVEHPEIVTIGPKAVREGTEVVGYPSVKTDRGGGITWHGPGQLVAYPIIKWRKGEQDIRGIIGRLEDWAIAALGDCGVEAYKDEKMQGAWVDSHKICSIGLSFRHWVSRHGMSINVCTPKGRVEGLEGCGMEAGVHTSLQSLGYSHDPEGMPIDCERIGLAMLERCDGFLGRQPDEPIEWFPEILA